MATENESQEELQKQLEETRKAQAGSDRTVTQLRAQVKELENSLAEATQESKGSEKEAQLERKERALNYAIKSQMDPEKVFDLLGINGADVEEQIDQLSEFQQAAKLEGKQEIAKKHGYTPHKSKLPTGPGSYDDLLNMSDDEIKAAGGAADRVMDQELKNSKQTLRKKLWGSL